MRSVIATVIGSTNIFMGIRGLALVHHIKPAGPASLRNLFINKVSTAQLESPIHLLICESVPDRSGGRDHFCCDFSCMR